MTDQARAGIALPWRIVLRPPLPSLDSSLYRGGLVVDAASFAAHRLPAHPVVGTLAGVEELESTVTSRFSSASAAHRALAARPGPGVVRPAESCSTLAKRPGLAPVAPRCMMSALHTEPQTGAVSAR